MWPLKRGVLLSIPGLHPEVLRAMFSCQKGHSVSVDIGVYSGVDSGGFVLKQDAVSVFSAKQVERRTSEAMKPWNMWCCE